ncbi:hypothetical protein [Tahibacter caeni]|uniref:hypothetical protein n=1 Tax=Tahibacter caeni TaxID=1453545 RepID=UPI0021498904|nr:hypothetical protein [Tahibacter caeni]
MLVDTGSERQRHRAHTRAETFIHLQLASEWTGTHAAPVDGGSAHRDRTWRFGNRRNVIRKTGNCAATFIEV